jgi:hypothetical protein
MPAVPAPDLLDAEREWLERIQQMRSSADAQEYAFIEAKRWAGWTWRNIASVLGLDSAQGAQKRHAGLVHRLDGSR